MYEATTSNGFFSWTRSHLTFSSTRKLGWPFWSKFPVLFLDDRGLKWGSFGIHCHLFWCNMMQHVFTKTTPCHFLTTVSCFNSNCQLNTSYRKYVWNPDWETKGWKLAARLCPKKCSLPAQTFLFLCLTLKPSSWSIVRCQRAEVSPVMVSLATTPWRQKLCVMWEMAGSREPNVQEKLGQNQVLFSMSWKGSWIFCAPIHLIQHDKKKVLPSNKEKKGPTSFSASYFLKLLEPAIFML